MVDIKDLRENPDKYRRGAANKNVKVDIDALIAAEESRLTAQREFEKYRAEQNEASKEIGKLKDAAAKQAAIAKVSELKTSVKNSEEAAKVAEARRDELLLLVPQPADDDVPVGKDASENVILYRWGVPRKFEFKPKSHIELGEALGILDFKAGVKLSGSRSYFLIGAGAELHNAILRFSMDMMTRERGFTAMTVPVLVKEPALIGTGFFPAGRESVYDVDPGPEEKFLTGTGEVGLTAFHLGETLDEKDLPKKYTTVSTCFRREAGTYGKDTAGLYRVHQFDKCEQVVICKNDIEESKQWHRTMLSYSEEVLKRLNLPYRVIQCCTGDLGVKNASMQDVETWMPSRANEKDPDSGYGETHSASRLYDFQARRMNLRYKDADGKLKFCHTLNNTVVASPRILIPIIENYQNADGSITIPDVLRPHMNGRDRIAKA